LVPKKAGAWGSRSYDNDSVHDILDGHRNKVPAGGRGFDEPVPDSELPVLLKELDELSRGVGDDLQHYLGVVVFLVSHGSAVPRSYRDMAIIVADDMLGDVKYLSSWHTADERKAELQKEIQTLRGGKAADTKIKMPATELVKHFKPVPGYDSPEGKSVQELERYLREIYENYKEWSDPAYGGGSFERMVLKFAGDDFYKAHSIAKAYLAMKGEKWASIKRDKTEESQFHEINDPVCLCGHAFGRHDRYCDDCGDDCSGFDPAPMEKQVEYVCERRAFGRVGKKSNPMVFERGKNDRILKVYFDGDRVSKAEFMENKGSQPETRQGWEGFHSFTQAFGD
jgi:hypothetical protein